MLSTERHESTFERLKSKLPVRSHNLMLACFMPHASDWLLSSSNKLACEAQMDVFGDHAICCHNGTSIVFWHKNIRDIHCHSARAASRAAVVTEKKNQIASYRAKPGDITVQQYHRGFASSDFDVTIAHPLQKKFIKIAM